jgi:hypothetical protein
MDEGMLDGVVAMNRFVNLVSSEPEISKVPIMLRLVLYVRDASMPTALYHVFQLPTHFKIRNQVQILQSKRKMLMFF